jgi:UDP-N-acetylmuramoylalanine--D-glutamate ligase
MSDYAAAKLRILQHQGEHDLAVLNWDDPVTRGFAAHCPGEIAFFSLGEEVACGAYLRRGQLTLRWANREVVVCPVSDVRLRGMHNVANVLAAFAVTHSLGVTPAQMAEAARTFEGVEHRLEAVRQLQGVWYIDDSIATSPERAMAALRSFDEPIVLLAGGRDKHLPWDEWAELAGRKATHVVVFGEAAALIEGQLSKLGKGAPPVLQADHLAQAVELARTVARPGDVVLFSPGGTSFDAFNDYAERGRVFKNLVAELELPGGARGTVVHEQRGQR